MTKRITLQTENGPQDFELVPQMTEVEAYYRQRGIEPKLIGYLLRPIEAEKSGIDHSVNICIEPDLVEAFNKFIKKWCGEHYPHLIDSDDNDGEFIRQKIRQALQTERTEK